LIGYPKDHYRDTFRHSNLDTRKVVESRDFRWLNKMFREEGEETNLVAVISDPNEPKTFHQAWNHKDLTEKDGWRSAIQIELANMEKRNVWQIIDQTMMPKERKVIGCKWVFKKKMNGDNRARLVTQGLSRVPGVDFPENFAPVIDDISFRIVLSLIQKWGCNAFALDVETAFLYGSLEEEIYMRIPEG
jgi:hypothetical protein